MINPQFGMPQGMEWLIILAIVVLVFGAAKLPELARGTGQALRIFKTETKGLHDDDKKDAQTPPAALPPTSTTQAQPVEQSDVEPESRADKHTG
ncbi:Sec-independent protein translocase subunit TatA [Nocardioides piscis]|uniref:Sec-independent protein translocase protein TatA n=1 Tax=Nocardioides piscis TaxID=2714938 RepID=A0A6G7YII0_9ACTN|nr:Sec-independent protein translocase subunit TatA [Nocardioides piscis]QIK76507.1 Sec-independent protein translocase subunit TatA [Nocardioides piscis]